MLATALLMVVLAAVMARALLPRRPASPPPPPIPASATAAAPPVAAPAQILPSATGGWRAAFRGPRSTWLELSLPRPPSPILAAALRDWTPPPEPAPGPQGIERCEFACPLPDTPVATAVLLRGRGLAAPMPPGARPTVVLYGAYANESEAGIAGEPANRAIVDTCPAAVLSLVVPGQREDGPPERFYCHPDAGLHPVAERALAWAAARLGLPPAAPVLAWGQGAGAALVEGLADARPGRIALAILVGGERFAGEVGDRDAVRIFITTRGDPGWMAGADLALRCRAAGAPGVERMVLPPNPWLRGSALYRRLPGPLAHACVAERIRRRIDPGAAPPPYAAESPAAALLRDGLRPDPDPAEDPGMSGPLLDAVPVHGLRPGREGDDPVRLAIRRAGAIHGVVLWLPLRRGPPPSAAREDMLRLAELGWATACPEPGCGGDGLARLLRAVAAAEPGLPRLVLIDALHQSGGDPAWLAAMLDPLPGLPVVAVCSDPAAVPGLPPGREAAVLRLAAEGGEADLALCELLPELGAALASEAP